MEVHGYITHAAHNRRFTAWLVLGYVLAFELIGAFALTMPLLQFDHEHTILSNPVGYAVRYAVPIAVFAGLVFWWMYRGHAKAVTHQLGVQIVTRADEPRFVQVAEEQCTALGVRLPRFGIIEAGELNAVTVGEGPNRGLIAVTRGLLDTLDDDELAAVLAHEASHIRQGDTKLLAANHALMRTAVVMQMQNPLRFENWRQMIIPLLISADAAGAAGRQRGVGAVDAVVAPGAARTETGPRLYRRRRGHPRHAFPRGPAQRDRENRRPWRVRRQLSRRGTAVRWARRPRGRQPSRHPGTGSTPSAALAAN